MARRTRQNNVSLEINDEQADLIAEKIAKHISKEITKAFAGINFSENRTAFSKKHTPKGAVGEILIDESVIPTGVDMNIESSNKELGKEETAADAGLSGSKKKLANLFKNK